MLYGQYRQEQDILPIYRSFLYGQSSLSLSLHPFPFPQKDHGMSFIQNKQEKKKKKTKTESDHIQPRILLFPIFSNQTIVIRLDIQSSYLGVLINVSGQPASQSVKDRASALYVLYIHTHHVPLTIPCYGQCSMRIGRNCYEGLLYGIFRCCLGLR